MQFDHQSSGNKYKDIARQWTDDGALSRNKWRARNKYFHELDEEYLRFLLPKDLKVLALGCGTATKLACVEPSFGVGVDISAEKISIASRRYPEMIFLQGDVEDPTILSRVSQEGPYDAILLYDTLGFVQDIQVFLTNIEAICTEETRIVSAYYSYFWEPILWIAEKLRLKMPTIDVTSLRMSDVEHFMDLAGLETVRKEWRILLPRRFIGIGHFINRYIATLPLIRKFCLRHYLVARAPLRVDRSPKSVSVVIPCRNEKGNIEDVVRRMPDLGLGTEIIFVEGGSVDGTWDEVQRVKTAYPSSNIVGIQQTESGKGNAVREGLDLARGQVFIILDADMTVAPEELQKFYNEIASGQGEYINGTRLIYPMEDRAMRFLNHIANRLFAILFSYLLNQRFTDTLCGTKALTRNNYQKISKNRAYFGDFDPFGDFDLIFGAVRLNLKVVEVPIRYKNRAYGETQISRFRHGLLLIKMVVFAYRKLKIV